MVTSPGSAAAALIGTLLLLGVAGPPTRRALTDSILPDARLINVLAKSQVSLAADLCWVRTSSLATTATSPEKARTLLAWAQLVTELDPKMYWPYAMGGLLGVVRVKGEYRNTAEAVVLLSRGLAKLKDPRLSVYLAFLQLHGLGDLDAAAETLKIGAQLPGAPPYLGQLATRLLVTRGKYEAARTFASTMAEAADPVTRTAFEHRLKEIAREELIRAIEVAAEAFRTRNGRQPTSISELVTAHDLPALPVDPLGGSLFLNERGDVAVTTGKRLIINAAPGDQD